MSGVANEVTAGGAAVRLRLDQSKYITGLQEAKRRLENFKTQFRNMSLAFAAAASVTTLAIQRMMKSFAAFGDELAKSAARAGLAINAYLQIGHAFTLTGASAAHVEKSMRGLNRMLYDASNGSTEAVRAFKDLGLSTSALLKMDPEQRFMSVVEALSAISDTGIQSALAMRTLGRAGMMILPLLAAGPDGLRRMREEAALLAGDMEESSRSAELLTDWFARLKLATQSLVATIGNELTPAFVGAYEWVTAYVVAVREMLQANPQLIEQFASLALRMLEIIVVAGTAISTMLLFSTPVGQVFLLVVALFGLLDALGVVNTGFGTFFENVKIGSNSLRGHFERLGDWLVNFMLLLGGHLLVAIEDVLLVVGTVMNGVIGIIAKGLGMLLSDPKVENFGDELLGTLTPDSLKAAAKHQWNRHGEVTGAIGQLEQESGERKAIDAGTKTLFESLQERAAALKMEFEKISAGSPQSSPEGMDFSPQVAAPKRGVHGFFGGQSILEQIGFSQGVGSIEDKMLAESEAQTGILNRIEQNTRDNAVLV